MARDPQMHRFRTIEPLRRMHADRVPYLMLERGVLRVDGHSFLFLQDENAFEIPGSLISCLLLGPGASVSHEAVKLAVMLWVGEGCTRLYAASHYRHVGANRLRVVVDFDGVQLVQRI